MLDKYLFNPGDKLPAENANSIDPDDVTEQTAGILTGGTSPSALSVFATLGLGANNGKISANIEGVVYNNLAIPLGDLEAASTAKISQTNYGDMDYSEAGMSSYHAQSFVANLRYITSVKLCFYANGNGSANMAFEIRTGTNPTAGSVVYSGTFASGTYANGNRYVIEHTLSSPLLVTPGDSYIFVWTKPAMNGNELRFSLSDTSLYADGVAWINGTQNTSRDFYFEIYGKSLLIDAGYAAVASMVQTAIRTATGSTETVVYSTDHFVITGAVKNRTGSVLKLISPSTGTDISGNGATKYLDLGTNAVETQGTGLEYYLMRYDEEGGLPSGYISSETITSGNFTVPFGTKRVLIEFTTQRGIDGPDNIGNCEITKVGKTVGKILSGVDGLANTNGQSYTWSGDTITVADIGSEAPTSWSTIAYYYRW